MDQLPYETKDHLELQLISKGQKTLPKGDSSTSLMNCFPKISLSLGSTIKSLGVSQAGIGNHTWNQCVAESQCGRLRSTFSFKLS